ncbi:LysR family transcriptional regulator [Pokkaliibacter plantistimulans]|uniref:LysR family transcriptional regulator n=1 Tax=Proteobacteria bacterium 228 TaxID=2083153 RepID=A0A2S5KKH0_9PROT|nr:LysR family transcriptional regulator [Pokkaliibacter plantistimulans]PPC75133.1 LysR family transcriptional regulator [Pokkaliibacter plantistimulans]
MEKWFGLNEFVALAETGSFTAAAERLSTSTANISRRLHALEKHLGLRLVERTTRHVALTELGRIYYQRCRPLLDSLDEAQRTLIDLQHSPSGKLRLTCAVAYGERHIAPLVNDFAQRYPELQIELHLSNRVVDIIDEGYDLAIRLGHLPESSLVARRLAPRDMYVCASPDYLARYGAPHSLDELLQHHCLVGTQDTWAFEEQKRTRLLRVEGRLHCNNGHAILDAALKGLGICQLPDFYVTPYLASGQLCELLPQFRQRDTAVWAVMSSNRYTSRKVRLLVDFLDQELKARLPAAYLQGIQP